MNASATSVGGWPATTLKKYLDEVFIYKLPEELQKVIISTKTISGYGKNLMEQIPIGGFVQPMLAIHMA